jgi:hypothetical protein
MCNTQMIHNVKKITKGKIERNEMHGEVYFTLHVEVEDEKGRNTDFTFFADDRETLKSL